MNLKCVCVCNSPAPDAFKQNMCSLFSFLFFLLQSSYSLFIKHPNEGIHREIYCGNSELRSHQQRSTKWLDDPQRVIMWNRAYWSNGPEDPETAPTMDAAHSCSPRMSDNLIERFERRKKNSQREMSACKWNNNAGGRAWKGGEVGGGFPLFLSHVLCDPLITSRKP